MAICVFQKMSSDGWIGHPNAFNNLKFDDNNAKIDIFNPLFIEIILGLR